MIERGARLTLDIEKPAAGGRMLARHGGQVVLVTGTIPGERVSAVVDRVGKGVVFADTEEVLTASPDRRPAAADWRCGGNVFSHIAYPRQLQVKAAIIRDGFTRIGRLPLPDLPPVAGSPETGYRMRARLHVQGSRIGFFREGTHQLCDAAATGQFLPATTDWIAAAARQLHERGLDAALSIELSENIPGDRRAAYIELPPGIDPSPYRELMAGPTEVVDVISVGNGASLTLTRDVRAFFQANRFLIASLVEHVVGLAGSGPVIDLYAGVGLFGLAVAARGNQEVIAVEGDPFSGSDLVRNAQPFTPRVTVHQQSVESFLGSASARQLRRSQPAFIVDPPRTGMTREALGGIINQDPPRIVYVSCDVATLARDARTLVDAGYELESLTGMDLFPNTAHVEAIALFVRG